MGDIDVPLVLPIVPSGQNPFILLQEQVDLQWYPDMGMTFEVLCWILLGLFIL